MKKLLIVSYLLFALIPFQGSAQFVLNGSAIVTMPECSDSTTTYQLTPDANTQAGEIWYTTQVSLKNRFDIQFMLFLGTKAYSVGADGICFVFQQQSVNAGSSGGGMGYGGITPSLAAEFDTYQNGWDPAFCHTAIEKNGDVDHTDLSGNNLAGPVQLSPTNPNLPDGNWHSFEIIWDPTLQTMSIYFDCTFRLSYTGDIIDSIFGGNPNVYWGFTGGTGGSDNTQEVCVGNSYLNNLRDTSFCAGGSVTMTAQGGVSYTWSPGAGLNTTTGPTVIATPTATTTYTVSIKNACGLISKDSTTITVDAIPTATMQPPANIICGGTSTGSATVVASNGTPPYSYLWMPGGNTNATASNLSAGTYTVTVSDGLGCSNSASVATVTITQPPPLRDSISSATSVLCNSTIGSASVGVTGGTGAYTYTWSPGGYTTATVTGLSGGSYSITVTDANGCTASPALVVNITQFAPLDITIASRTTVICEQFGYITAHAATGGAPPYTYLWTPSGGTDIATTTDLSAGTYTITATDSAGCSATASETISYPPKLTISNGAITGTSCYGGDNGSASVSAAGGTPVYTYSWYPSGGTKSSASGLSACTYTVTATDSNGCAATTAVVITEAPPMVITTDSVDVTANCTGQASVSVISGGTPPYTYLWNPGGETTATISGQCAGDYCCTVTQANGCSQTVCVVVVNVTGIPGIDQGNGNISVYPNPNNGEFTIQTPDGSGQLSVEIYNVLGQKIYSILNVEQSDKLEINLRDKSAGVYFYRILKSDGGVLGTGKIMVQK